MVNSRKKSCDYCSVKTGVKHTERCLMVILDNFYEESYIFLSAKNYSKERMNLLDKYAQKITDIIGTRI